MTDYIGQVRFKMAYWTGGLTNTKAAAINNRIHGEFDLSFDRVESNISNCQMSASCPFTVSFYTTNAAKRYEMQGIAVFINNLVSSYAGVDQSSIQVGFWQINQGSPLPIAVSHTQPTQSGNSSDSTYTVKSGDTLSKIANLYKAQGCNITYQQIAQANNIANVNNISVGQVLRIPCNQNIQVTNTGNTTGNETRPRIAPNVNPQSGTSFLTKLQNTLGVSQSTLIVGGILLFTVLIISRD